MRKIILSITALLIGIIGFAQTTNGFNFKALVTNNGNPVASSLISVKVTFKEGTSIKWQETHSTVHTDANGIFSIVMGEGTRVAGVTSFDKVDWNVGNMNYTVEVDTGSGYQTLVSNEYFKRVPYAKVAERLAPTDYDVITNNQNIWAKNDGTGHWTHGFRLSHGTTDWYTYMKSGDGYAINKDGVDYFGIDPTNAKAWFKGKLDLPASGIVFRNTSGSYTNSFSLTSLSDGLAFKYNNAQVMKMHGANQVEISQNLKVDGKVLGDTSGNNDMKAYAYGEWFSSSARHLSSNVTITKDATNHKYRVNFASGAAPSSTDDYIVLANIYVGTGFVKVSKSPGYFYIYTYDTSGAAAMRDITFVVYKK